MFGHDLLVAPAPRGYFPRPRDHLRHDRGNFQSLGATRTPHHQEVPLLLTRSYASETQRVALFQHSTFHRQNIRADAALHEERTHEQGTPEPSRTTPNCQSFSSSTCTTPSMICSTSSPVTVSPQTTEAPATLPQFCTVRHYNTPNPPDLTLVSEQMKIKLRDNIPFFAWEEKQTVDESARPGKPKSVNEIFGVEGTFKKLELD
jgi:hypothetical protein